MDTKLKSNKKNKIVGVLISFILLTILSIGIVEFYTPISKNAVLVQEKYKTEKIAYESQLTEYLKEEFMQELYKSNFVLYWDILQKSSNTILKPSDIFLTENMNKSKSGVLGNESNANESQNETREYEVQSFCDSINSLLSNWEEYFYSQTIMEYPSFEYYIIDNTTGKILTNSIDPLERLMESTSDVQNFIDSYPFFIVFQSGENGQLSVSGSKGLEAEYIDEFLSMQLTQDTMQQENYFNNWYQYYDQIVGPKNVTIIYASHDNDFYYSEYDYHSYYSNPVWTFIEAGFGYLCAAVLLLILLFALILPFKKSWGIGKGFASHLPFEISLVAMLSTLGAYEALASFAWETINGGFTFDFNYTVLSANIQHVLTYGFNVLLWMTVLFIWYVGILSMRQVFSLGLIRYFKEKTLTGRFLRVGIRTTKKMMKSLGEIDLTAKSNRTIIKILAVNFVILALLCCVWFFGIAVLIPYTIIVFFILRKYFDDIKKQYAVLLEATSKIASGNLEVSIEENLGVFEPLKAELTKIQQGFQKAVREETKSERMKTELITNVSHDLKTPLTAIITYVGLLKEENVSEEDRKSYVDTLDQKSQRLKRLIEDLFEVSKAASHNITLNLVEVDLANLIKQVLLELDDKIAQVEVEFRVNLPEQKIILNLDSEKTYRIFENLIINITKYAMPHSRAYIEMTMKEDSVTVVLKNISAVELNYNTEELSERFVRGDQSRNTEGSGLGLAIVKNFVELQGGKFTIIADGDLFKAIIEWKKQ